MSKQGIEIEVQPRSAGKGVSGKVRREKMIPSVIYGPKIENMNFMLAENTATKYTRREFGNAILTLKSADPKMNGIKAIIKSYSKDPLSRRPLHIDFYAPDMTRAIRVFVEIEFVGKPIGLADGGVFSPLRRNIEVECLPSEIPDRIAADVSGLGLNDSLHIYDLQPPQGVKFITSADTAIANCAIVKEEEAAAPAADAAAAAGAATEGAAAAPAAGAAAAPAAGDKKEPAKK
jgi:large subunit ribosomal protein L25